MSNVIDLDLLNRPDPPFSFVTDLYPGIYVTVLPSIEVTVTIDNVISFVGTSGYIPTGTGTFTIEAVKNNLVLDTRQVTVTNQRQAVTLFASAVIQLDQFPLQQSASFPLQSSYSVGQDSKLPSLQSARTLSRYSTRVMPLV